MSDYHQNADWLTDITAYDLDAQRRWSDATFGEGKRVGGVLDHIRKELVEVAEHPEDLSEWADLLILAIDGATRQGYSGAEVVKAYHTKMRENRRREWPPIPEGGFPEDQAVEHVQFEVKDGFGRVLMESEEVVTSKSGRVTVDVSGLSDDD